MDEDRDGHTNKVRLHARANQITSRSRYTIRSECWPRRKTIPRVVRANRFPVVKSGDRCRKQVNQPLRLMFSIAFDTRMIRCRYPASRRCSFMAGLPSRVRIYRELFSLHTKRRLYERYCTLPVTKHSPYDITVSVYISYGFYCFTDARLHSCDIISRPRTLMQIHICAREFSQSATEKLRSFLLELSVEIVDILWNCVLSVR